MGGHVDDGPLFEACHVGAEHALCTGRYFTWGVDYNFTNYMFERKLEVILPEG